MQAVAVPAQPVVAQAVMASPLPATTSASDRARTANPLSSTRIAPGALSAPTLVSSGDAQFASASTAHVVGAVAASFAVEDDGFDDPGDTDMGNFSTDGFTVVVAGGASPHETGLQQFLEANDLAKFEGHLRSLGAVDVPDLHELDEVSHPTRPASHSPLSHSRSRTLSTRTIISYYLVPPAPALCRSVQADMLDLGMKKLETKRMQRGLVDLNLGDEL